MIFETPQDRDYRAADRDRLWGAWPRACGEVRTLMQKPKQYHPRRPGPDPYKIVDIDPMRDILDAKDKQIEQLEFESRIHLQTIGQQAERIKELETCVAQVCVVLELHGLHDSSEAASRIIGNPQSYTDAQANQGEGKDRER